jgi:cytochrome c2
MCTACESDSTQAGHSVPGANAERGKSLIVAYGCSSCHVVPGIRDAHATVGPSLESFDRRMYVAGMLPNQLEPLMRWIMEPQKIIPGNAMPDMRVSPRDARDIAAFLYTLR